MCTGVTKERRAHTTVRRVQGITLITLHLSYATDINKKCRKATRSMHNQTVKQVSVGDNPE